MDTIGEDGTGSKENRRQAEGTSGKSKSNPLYPLLKNYLRHLGKRTFDLTTGRHVSKGVPRVRRGFSGTQLFEKRRAMRHSHK